MNERLFDWLVSLSIAEAFEVLSWLPHIIKAKLHGQELVYRDLHHCLGPLARQPVRRRRSRSRAETSELDTSADEL